MRAEDVVRAPTTPLDASAFPAGAYRFTDREYLNITYRTDPEVLERVVPEPLRLVVGHPFDPPHLVPLVEVVPGERSSSRSPSCAPPATASTTDPAHPPPTPPQTPPPHRKGCPAHER
ncbi:acetoacetate decarboxylase family protein [Streptomyces sp. NBC_00483]|uniref:acetoacetate decarboxylase family protein n=1 Tax=Streptomyces sp. NBC_00483 TaxID=2975756 RepID=UPI003FCEB660